MIQQIVDAGMKVGAGIANIIQQKKAFKERQKNLENRQRENENLYNRRMNEDYTQRADAQAAISKMKDNITALNKGSAGSSAVMGGTIESQQAARAMNAKALSDTYSNIAVQGAQTKDNYEQSYLTQKNKLDDMQDQQIADKQAAMSEAITQLGNAASSSGLGGMIDDKIAAKKGSAA